MFRGDGQVRWTQWVNHAVFDEQGRRLELQATGRDITEQRQDGEAAAWLAAVVASADDAIVSKTLDGIVTSWNRGAELLFGYSAAEASDARSRMIIPPDRLPEEQEILARLRRGESIDHFETERIDEGRPARSDLAQRVPGPRRPRARDRRLEDRARQQREAARPAAPRGERADAGDALSPGGADRPRTRPRGGGGRRHPGDPVAGPRPARECPRLRRRRRDAVRVVVGPLRRLPHGRRRAFALDARGARPAADPGRGRRVGAGARGAPADDPRRRHPRDGIHPARVPGTPARKVHAVLRRAAPRAARGAAAREHGGAARELRARARRDRGSLGAPAAAGAGRAARGGRRAQGGRARQPRQGRVPRHARPRAAQPAGRDRERDRAHRLEPRARGGREARERHGAPPGGPSRAAARRPARRGAHHQRPHRARAGGRGPASRGRLRGRDPAAPARREGAKARPRASERAGDRARRPGPAPAGARQPGEQRLQVHAGRGLDPRLARGRGRPGGAARARRRRRDPDGPARLDLRALRPGESARWRGPRAGSGSGSRW